jgi:hypothetical protein
LVLDALVDNVWVPVLVWAAMFALDYALTLRGAGLARAAGRHIVFSGGYELTPIYREDVVALRRISPRFVGVLLLVAVLIAVEWQLARFLGLATVWFEALLGLLLLTQAAIQFRHIRNLKVLTDASKSAGMRGRIEYSRWFSLRASAVELFEFAGLFGLVWVLTGRWFFAGGCVGCLLLGLGHRRLAGREPPAPWDES